MCFGGSRSGKAPGAPDLTGMSQASQNIGSEANQSAQNQQQWAQTAVTGQQNQTANAQNTLNTQAGQAFGGGAAGQQYFQGSVLPAAQQNLQAAQQWGSPGGVAQAQAAAGAQTAQAYDAARMNNQRQLQAYGVDPSTLRGGFANLQSNLAQAGATGTAMYGAGQQRQLQGMALTNQAVGQGAGLAGVGQGYTAEGANMTGTGVQLGNQTLATGSQAMLAPSQWYQTALSGYGQGANIATQNFQNQLANAQYSNQINTQAAAGIGQGVGMIGGLAADYFSAADGGAIPARPRRYDDGGGVAIPQSQGTGIPPRTYSPQIQTGGTTTPVGKSPEELQQEGQQAFMGGVAKGFMQTYKFADGGYAGAGPTHYYDGGDVSVPTIMIQPPSNVGINKGGANLGQQPGANQQKATQSGFGLGQALGGGMFGGGGGSLGLSAMQGSGMAGLAGSTAGSAGDSAIAGDIASSLASAADGGPIKQRKRQVPGNGAPNLGKAQNPGQRPTKSMGDAGPMTFADGGPPSASQPMMRIPTNPERMYGIPQPHPQHLQQSHAQVHPTQLPSFARLKLGHAADGGMPGPTWSMGNVADGGHVPHEPGTFVSQGASDGTGIDDQVPAKVSVGEYVVPADVVHMKGKKFFDDLVAKYHTPAAQQRQQMGLPQHHGSMR